MARLREVVEAEGAQNARSYIASGNVVFESDQPASALTRRLEQAIEREFGHNVVVVVLTARDMAEIVKRNPFPKAEPGTLHVAFAAKPIAKSEAGRLSGLDFPPEELAVAARHVYFHLPNGYGRARLPAEIDRIVGKTATVRNWRTVEKLSVMAGERQ